MNPYIDEAAKTIDLLLIWIKCCRESSDAFSNSNQRTLDSFHICKRISIVFSHFFISPFSFFFHFFLLLLYVYVYILMNALHAFNLLKVILGSEVCEIFPTRFHQYDLEMNEYKERTRQKNNNTHTKSKSPSELHVFLMLAREIGWAPAKSV